MLTPYVRVVFFNTRYIKPRRRTLALSFERRSTELTNVKLFDVRFLKIYSAYVAAYDCLHVVNPTDYRRLISAYLPSTVLQFRSYLVSNRRFSFGHSSTGPALQWVCATIAVDALNRIIFLRECSTSITRRSTSETFVRCWPRMDSRHNWTVGARRQRTKYENRNNSRKSEYSDVV